MQYQMHNVIIAQTVESCSNKFLDLANSLLEIHVLEKQTKYKELTRQF